VDRPYHNVGFVEKQPGRRRASFYPDEHGNRSMMMIFDMAGSWQLPAILEPLFTELGASVHVTPVMTAEDLQRGFKEAGM
jgi:hypothetical protein